METQPRYALVGFFILTLFTGGIIFLLWLSDFSLNGQHADYVINFRGSVSGLKVGSPVRYRGVPVGTVTRISINPKNVEEVRVLVDLDGDTPIKEDAIASLEMQGITGLSFVQITGGTQGAAELKALAGEKYPVIPSRPSKLDEVIDAAPQIVGRLLTLLSDASDVFSEPNRQAFAETMNNIRVITGALAEESHTIGKFIHHLERIGPVMETTAYDLRKTVHTYEDLARKLTNMVDESSPGIRNFSTVGLHEATSLIVDLRRTTTIFQHFLETTQKKIDTLFKEREGGFRL